MENDDFFIFVGKESSLRALVRKPWLTVYRAHTGLQNGEAINFERNWSKIDFYHVDVNSRCVIFVQNLDTHV